MSRKAKKVRGDTEYCAQIICDCGYMPREVCNGAC